MVGLSTVLCVVSFLLIFGENEIEGPTWKTIVLGIGFSYAIGLWLAGKASGKRISNWSIIVASSLGLVVATLLVIVGVGEYVARDDSGYFSFFALVPLLMGTAFAVSIFVVMIGTLTHKISQIHGVKIGKTEKSGSDTTR